MAPKSRGLLLTISAVLFAALALSNFSKPFHLARNTGPALLAEKDVMRFSAAAFQSAKLQIGGLGLNKFLLDPDVNHKRTAGQALTIAAMTRVDDKRTGS